MKKFVLILFVLIFTFVLTPKTRAKGSRERKLFLPGRANYENVLYLGKKRDPKSKKVVEGFAFIYRKDTVREGKKTNRGKKTGCYGYLSKGAKWKVVEPWEVNPTNTQVLDYNLVFSTLKNSVLKWENAAGTSEGNPIDILGDGFVTNNFLEADLSSPDGKNEVYFADVSSPGAVAVTIVWGVFRGPVSQRELVEWDQVYDEVDFDWSVGDPADPQKMDFENVATHELGHSVGMDDLYRTNCSEETMYGYVTGGETKKRDLNAGDITGVDKLYHL